jgi:hypothetical protein
MKCSAAKLREYLEKKMSLDEELEVVNHLGDCKVCQEVFFFISRDRDADLFVRYPQKAEHVDRRSESGRSGHDPGFELARHKQQAQRKGKREEPSAVPVK